MTRIWNGLNEDPHILPDDCFCAGANVGDFIELPCGHGGPEQAPMHVKCVISRFVPADGDDPQPPECPMCRGPVDQDALSLLTAYIRQGDVVSFANEAGREQKTRIYGDLEEGLELADTVARARRLADGADAIQPTEEERQPGYWTDERDKINGDFQTLRFELEAQEHTPEDLDHVQAELDALKGRLIGLSGRATLFEHRDDVFRERNGSLSYEDVRGEISLLSRGITTCSNDVLAAKTVPSLTERVTAISAAIEGGNLTLEELSQKEAELIELRESFDSLKGLCGQSDTLYPDLLKQGLELLDHAAKAFLTQRGPTLVDRATAINATIGEEDLTPEELQQKGAELAKLKEDFDSLKSIFGESHDLYPKLLKQGLELLKYTTDNVEVQKKTPPLVERVTDISTALESGTLALEELDQKEAELKDLRKGFNSLRDRFGTFYDLYPERLKQGLGLWRHTANTLLAQKGPILVEHVTAINTVLENENISPEELDQKEAELTELKKSFDSLKSVFGNVHDLYPESLKQGLESLHQTAHSLSEKKSAILMERVTAIKTAVEPQSLSLEELEQKDSELKKLKEHFESLENLCGNAENLYPGNLKQGIKLLEDTSNDVLVRRKIPSLIDRMTAIDAEVKEGNLTRDELDQKERDLEELRDNFRTLRDLCSNVPGPYPDVLRQGLRVLDATMHHVFIEQEAPSFIEEIEALNAEIEGRALSLEELDQREARLFQLKGRFDSFEELYEDLFDDPRSHYPQRLEQGLQLLDRTIENFFTTKEEHLIECVTAVKTALGEGTPTLEELNQRETELDRLNDSFKSFRAMFGGDPSRYSEGLENIHHLLDHTGKDLLAKKGAILVERVTTLHTLVEEGGLTNEELNQKKEELLGLKEDSGSLRSLCRDLSLPYSEDLKHGALLLQCTIHNIFIEREAPALARQIEALNAEIEGGNLSLEELHQKETELLGLKGRFDFFEGLFDGIFEDPRPYYSHHLQEGLQLLDHTIGNLFSKSDPILAERLTEVSTAIGEGNLTLEELDQKEAELAGLSGSLKSFRSLFGDRSSQYPERLEHSIQLLDRTGKDLLAKKGAILVRRVTEINTAIEEGKVKVEELDQKKEELTKLKEGFSSLKDLCRDLYLPYPEDLKRSSQHLDRSIRDFANAEIAVSLVDRVTKMNAELEAGNLTLEELEQKEAEIKDLKEDFESSRGHFSSWHALYRDPFYRGLEFLERTTNALHEEKLAIRRYQEEGREGAKAIWSGYDTEPLTKPSACTVCSGDKGGEFITLDCGHGASGHGPLHVRCVLDGLEVSVQNDVVACCPTCQEPVGAGTLARLAERVGDERPVTYPDENGTEKKGNLVASPDEQTELVDSLVGAENLRAGRPKGDEFDPRHEEYDVAYYDQMIDDVDQFIERINAGVREQTYAPEELKADRYKLSRLEDRLQVAAGRIAMFGKGSEHWGDFDEPEGYDRLRRVLDRVNATDLDLRREQERAEQRERGHSGHPERLWNGSEGEPLVKSRECFVCFGEFNGEFMSLDCGHGQRGNKPLHVRCLLDIASNAANAGTEARCPACSVSFSEDALSCLADCVERNREVPFLNDAGETETTRLFDDSEEQQREKDDIVKSLKDLQASHSGEHKPGGADDDIYAHLAQQVEDMVLEVETAMEEHTYTREELEEKQREVDELDRRAGVAVKRAAQATGAQADPALKEKYQRLSEARERLEDTSRRMRQEEEEMKRREEQEHGHLHPA